MSPALTDALALLAFAATGVWAHEKALPIGALIRAALPFLFTWYLLAPFTRLYRSRGLRALLVHWAIAVPSGVMVRWIALAEPLDPARALFLLTSLVFSLPYLLLFRLATGNLRREAK